MKYDRYSGDPRLVLTQDGADLDYRGGQPVMDQGLENQALLSLFTAPGWWGNAMLPAERQIGSDFERVAAGPISLQTLSDVERSVSRTLKSPLFPRVDVRVTNPVTNRLRIEIVAGGRSLVLDRAGLLWQAQADYPASARVTG